MKKITILEQESKEDQIFEAAISSFEQDLDALIAQYSETVDESFKAQMRSKLSESLKKKSQNL